MRFEQAKAKPHHPVTIESGNGLVSGVVADLEHDVMYISASKKNGFFERGCDKKPDFCTRNVQVFGVQENGFLALRVKEN